MPTLKSQPVKDRQLTFVHIPKTAGTSLYAALINYYKPAPDYYGDMSIFEQEYYELAWGHYTYPSIRDRFPNSFFLTFLRDPVDRFISQYRSLNRPEGLTPEWEAAISPEEREAIDFCHNATLEEFATSEMRWVRGYVQEPYLFYLAEPDAEDPLASALENLHKIEFLGLQGRWSDSLRMLGKQIGVQFSEARIAVRENVSETDDLVMSVKGWKALEERIGRDRIIYDAAVKLFETRFAEASARRKR